MAPQKLLTEELREQLPELYATEATPMVEKLAVAKFFTPDSNWSWYPIEFDGKDTFFGLVDGLEREYGYFSLSELESIRGPLGLPIERDLSFKPTPLVELDSSLKVEAEAKPQQHSPNDAEAGLEFVFEVVPPVHEEEGAKLRLVRVSDVHAEHKPKQQDLEEELDEDEELERSR